MVSKRYERIYAVVKHIPKGRVATYGQIASLAGLIGQARQVGYAMHALPEDNRIPWHRVINARGEISRRSERCAEEIQRSLLEAEDIRFDGQGRISLDRYRWEPRSGQLTDRRTFLSWLGLTGLGTLQVSTRSGEQARAEKPNILFIVVDDLRTQLGCYGHQETSSPHIDRLATRGTVFERAYCQVPVCGPSRVSVLTGIRTASGQWRCSDLKTDFISLPAYLKKHGYHALSNGKVFHHLHDRQEDWSEPPWRSIPIYHAEGDWAKHNTHALWQDEGSIAGIHPKTKRGPFSEAAEVEDHAYQDGKVADKTIEDLKRLKGGKRPFFLACGFWRPHLPFNAPKKYWDRYERERIAIASNRYRPDDLPKPCKSSTEIDRYGGTGARKSEEDFHRQARHAYYACVSYVDAQIGKIMGALDALGLSENTVVVFWGDHGWHLGEHGFWGKHNTLNNAIQAPLIVRAPGRRPNNRTAGLVEFVDIYPTLCELAGLPVPNHVQGTSFIPLLDHPERAWKKAVFSRWSGCASVKTDRYLFTEWKTGGQATARMLFDHLADPQENVNIAGLAENAELIDALGKLLHEGWTAARPAREEK